MALGLFSKAIPWLKEQATDMHEKHGVLFLFKKEDSEAII